VIVRDVARRLRARGQPAAGPSHRRWRWAPLVVLLVGLGARSLVRSLDWRNGLTLYAHDLQLQPDSFVLLNDYGVELVRADRVAESESYFRRSTEAAPYWNINWSNLGAVQESLGRRGDAELSFKRSIANGAYSLAYEGYARLLANAGRLDDARRFLKDEALPQFPQNQTLAEIYATVGERGR
jgi:Tfp pilus assembly protein PilF